MKKTLLAFLVFWVCGNIICGNQALLAQSHVASAEIGGVVRDSSEAVLAGSLVTVKNPETGRVLSAVTNGSGEYRIKLLPPGLYEIQAARENFSTQSKKGVEITVGQIAIVDFQLEPGAISFVVQVTETLSLAESERTQQSHTVDERNIRSLPIDRRDYLTYTLLSPGVVDARPLTDASDFRIGLTASTGLSFFGNNGRGNGVKIDGGEADDPAGGVRPTLSQEAVQEFQINSSNYSAELGGASGGVINIVSKSGTNSFRGSLYGFFRHQSLDAANSFASTLVNGVSTRIKPPSKRQQFGATLGGPLAINRTFFFSSFEGLDRRESSAVSVLTNNSIFGPTPEQQFILSALPAPAAAALGAALSASPSTRALFETNNGVFPFNSGDYKFSFRIDHGLAAGRQLMIRYNYANIDETNPNTGALVGISRATETSKLDHNLLLGLTSSGANRLVNELRLQFNYGDLLVGTREKFGPSLDINGFGFFNRDNVSPSGNIGRRYEVTDNLSIVRGSHAMKLGGQLLLRGIRSESQALFSGRFSFGSLPGSLVSPVLAPTSINGLQAFNLGLPLSYNQGFGNPVVASTNPFYAIYFTDRWKPVSSLVIDLGIRYELDDRRDPLPTDKNNFAPRVALAWQPGGRRATTVRAGYGIFYTPTFYFVDWVANALGDVNGKRQIAQVVTTIQTPGAASSVSIFQTLRAQGVLTIPTPNRAITPADLQQFGITVSHVGPVPALSALFKSSPDYVNAYAQHASLGIEHEFGRDLLVAVNYQFARTLNIVRPRDDNLLPAPIDPVLGIRVWSPLYFKRPELLSDNVYESTGRADYHGLTVEVKKRLSNAFSLNMNYTFSKAIDEIVDYNSDFEPNDQANLRGERSLSSFDQRHQFILYATLQGSARTGSAVRRVLIGQTSVSPIVHINSGRPFNLLAGFDLNQDRHSTTDRPAFAGRNTGIGPSFSTLDVRFARRLSLGESRSLEFIADGFNVLNKLNYRSINNTVGNISGPFNLKGRSDVGPSQPLGFTSAFEARRLQLGFRVNF